VAVGACGSDAWCVGWTGGTEAFFARVDPRQPAAAPVALDRAAGAVGRLEVISGPHPLVWHQRSESVDTTEQRWTSSLVLPGHAPLTIDGLVHAVAWWGTLVAIVGSDDLQLLRR
jgi:hypothetical protein